MGYDRRSPFSVSDTWSSSPNYGPTSHDQPWVVVDTDGSYNTAAAPAQFTLMGQMTVIGTSGERCSFQSASNALTGHRTQFAPLAKGAYQPAFALQPKAI